MSYPGRWRTYRSRDPGIQFIVGPDDRTTVYVRIVQLDAPVAPSAQKTLVDQLLGQITVLDESRVAANGLAGLQVVYAVAGTPGNPAVHIHVFLFEGSRLHTIVFETPRFNLTNFAPLVDRMRDSYRALPVTPAVSASPGATAPASAAPR